MVFPGVSWQDNNHPPPPIAIAFLKREEIYCAYTPIKQENKNPSQSHEQQSLKNVAYSMRNAFSPQNEFIRDERSIETPEIYTEMPNHISHTMTDLMLAQPRTPPAPNIDSNSSPKSTALCWYEAHPCLQLYCQIRPDSKWRGQHPNRTSCILLYRKLLCSWLASYLAPSLVHCLTKKYTITENRRGRLFWWQKSIIIVESSLRSLWSILTDSQHLNECKKKSGVRSYCAQYNHP